MNFAGGIHPPGMPHGLGPAPPGAPKGSDPAHHPMGSMPPQGPMPPHGAMPPSGPRPPLPLFDDGTVGPHGGGPNGGGGPHRRMLRGADVQA